MDADEGTASAARRSSSSPADATADAATDSAAVSADGLAKRYGDVAALDDVSLTVASGEVLALVGPNGAGKTTLIRCLTGTVTPDEGAARLLGEPPRDADRQRIGVLPQSFSPPDRLTARELLAYYAGLYDDARGPADALETVGLAGSSAPETWYENLSGGQQRRVCVAAALVNDPDVLFLDEPTTGIDPEGRRAVWDVLESLVGAGTTLVLTTHDMAEAARLADRVAVLVDGELAAVDAPDRLVAEHGGASALRVELAAGDETNAARNALSDVGFAADRIDATDGAIAIECGPGEVAAVVRAFDDAGVTFEALEWREPSLDDVYVALAGAGSAPGGPDAAGVPGEQSADGDSR